jgi:hypothetical protein
LLQVARIIEPNPESKQGQTLQIDLNKVDGVVQRRVRDYVEGITADAPLPSESSRDQT